MNRVSASSGLSSRTPFWSSTGPYASIRVCITLLVGQAVLLPVMLMGMFAAMLVDGIGNAAANAIALLWLAMPLGAVYGIWLGLASNASEDRWGARGVGILCNAVYLLAGVLFAYLCIAGSQQQRPCFRPVVARDDDDVEASQERQLLSPPVMLPTAPSRDRVRRDDVQNSPRPWLTGTTA